MRNPQIGIARAIKRFERAVERKAFEGTIPLNSDDREEQAELDAAHHYIKREYKLARARLEAMLKGKY